MMKYFNNPLKLLLLLLALAVALPSATAGELTVCEGTEYSDIIPLNGYDFDNCKKNQQIQMIYPASMLTSMQGGTITHLKFYTRSGVKFHDGPINVSMGTTTTESFDASATPITDLTAVITGMNVTATASEWELELSTPYTYNGDNLVIEFVQTEDGGYGDTYFYGQNQSQYASLVGAFSAVSWSTNYTPNTFLPKLTLTYTGGGGTPDPGEECQATIAFMDNGSDSSTSFTADDLEDFKAYLDGGADYVNGIACDRVYKGATGIKFSASKNNGWLTIELAPLSGDETWKSSKIIINAKRYGTDAASMTVEGSSDEATLTDELADYEFVLDGEPTLESITINATKRIYVKSITIVHACSGGGEEPTLQEVSLSFPEDSYTATLGEAFTAPVLTVDPASAASEVVYSSSDPAVATVAADGTVTLVAAGTTTITAAISGSEAYQDQSTSYTLTVEEAPAPGGTEYVLVTSNDQLAPGKQFIIVSTNKKNQYAEAMGRQSSNFRGVATVAVTEDKKVLETTADTEILTLEKDDDGYWLLKASVWEAGGYLYASGANSNNYLNTGDVTDNRAQATIDIASDGEATVKFNLTGTQARNWLRINTSLSPSRYTCYRSGQNPIYIYVKNSNEPVVEDPLSVALTAAPAEPYTVGDNVTVHATVENGNENTMVTYKINDGEEQTYNAQAGIVLPNDKAGDVTVSVYATDGEREATDEVTYHFNAAEAFAITFTPDGTEEYTVGDQVNVKVGVENAIGDYTVTYTIDGGEEKTYDAENGIDIPNDRADDVVLTVNVTDGYEHAGEGSASATYHFNAAPAIEVTLTPASGSYYLDEQATVTVSALNTIGDALITYQIGDGEEQFYDEQAGIVITAEQAGTVLLTVSVTDGYHEGIATATGEYTFAARPVVAAPVFSLVSGTYGAAQTLTITGAEGATIYYTTDGTEPTTASTPYDDAIELGEGTTTVKAIAVKDGMVSSEVITAQYIIDIPEELPTIGVLKGYYTVKNNGNNQYADIRGRKTLTFTGDIDKKAGTVIWLETNDKGQVQSLRSQGADLQGYANRAMKYIPEIVQLAVDKLNAEGTGEILGANGLDEIMETFDACFDPHLYVEEANGGYRLYGKTPSMQHVVDFYRDHKHQVETKLPNLEAFINSAIDKVLEKTGGQGGSILQHFSLHETWQRMSNSLAGATLTEPVDSATTMEFYRQVLNNKNYVWSFAYETAMTYWERIKNHPQYESKYKPMLGEFADYIEKIEYVRPEFKYYVVQENNKPDFVSEGNKDIRDNAARTIWTLEERDSFTVNINLTEDNKSYYTTLYTDFAYSLPEGVEAYIVTGINTRGVTMTKKVNGTIPAQTPILLKATAAGDQVLTLATSGNADVSGNLLVGADYFIKQYQLKTPQVVSVFDLVKDLLGETFYNNYVTKYEHLMLKNSGTVNNKYFWGLTQDDLYECIERDENDEGICVVRSLSNGVDGLGFYDNWTAGANQAFLSNYTFDPVKLVVRNDVTRDGVWDIDDVTATISIILANAPKPNNYDYEAANFNNDDIIDVDDVTEMISYILGK